MSGEISQSLALSMAGMIAAGLSPGDEQENRALASLLALGLMLGRATNHDALVEQQLQIAETSKVERLPDGSLQITWSAWQGEPHPPPGEAA